MGSELFKFNSQWRMIECLDPVRQSIIRCYRMHLEQSTVNLIKSKTTFWKHVKNTLKLVYYFSTYNKILRNIENTYFNFDNYHCPFTCILNCRTSYENHNVQTRSAIIRCKIPTDLIHIPPYCTTRYCSGRWRPVIC